MSANWFLDASRAVLRASGPDARAMIQDLVTNDLDQLGEGDLVYAALLTPQGKYLFDFFIGADEGGDGFLIDIAADRAGAFAQRLAMYRLRRKMEIAPADLSVALFWGDAPPPPGARADPRSAAMGWRIYGADLALTEGAREASRADLDLLRVRHCVPETGVELQPDETYILEAGFERLNGVDFRKGCYVGQEVTARMKHKTTLKKGLVRVSVEGDAAPGTPIEADGKPAGALFTVAGGEGLAHLRFDRAEGAMRAGGATVRRIDA
ncbi:folate-binding protein [Pikeienuella sp. HZG-20]|uniref:CAF17-like 4Fe-4S cluster assembly/insertion protein YgfZ n=1 Tax=Paludibacillus litoralis TaxID=3133267 RepID=UPI0030ED6EEF